MVEKAAEQLEPAAGPTRERVLRAATRLLAQGGRDAVSTRAVSAAAGVQPPVIYRLFGDKQGLLDAVAAEGFAEFAGLYDQQPPLEDALDDLRRGWDVNVDFGLANPYLYALVYGDPTRYQTSPTTAAARRVVQEKVARLARTGRLQVEQDLAVDLLLSTGSGVTLALIAGDAAERDLTLSRVTREAVLASVCAGVSRDVDDLAGAARAVRAGLEGDDRVSAGERALVDEVLQRLSR